MNSADHNKSSSAEQPLSYHELRTRYDELQKCNDELSLQVSIFDQAEQNTQSGTWTWIPDTNEAKYSDNMFRLFGMEPNEVVPDFNTIPQFVHPEDRPGLLESAASMKEADQVRTGVFRIIRKDGVLRYCRNVIRYIHTPDGKTMYIGTMQDITDQKQLEQENITLKEKQAQQATDRYYALFNSIDQAFCTLEVKFDDKGHPIDYKFLEVSDSFPEQTGLKNALGNWIRDLVEEHDEYWFTTYGNVALTGEPARTELYSASLGRWWSIYAYRIDDPALRHVAVLFNDITEKKEAERTLQESEKNHLKELEQQVAHRTEELKALNRSLVKKNKELRQKNNDIASFSYAAGHYLKEPLRKIYTFIELILMKEQDGISEAGREHFKKVQSSAQRLSLLTDDIMTFSMLNSIDERLTDVDLNETLAIVKNEIRSHLSAADASIDAGELHTIKGYSGPLQILFKHMLSNAIKFRDANKPMIRISSTVVEGKGIKHPDVIKEAEYLRLMFSDNGIGFEPQYADKVFTMFNRLDNSDKYPGTGIGLSLCRKVVQLHNGFITVESTPGKGTTFSCYLQLHLKA